MCVHVCTCVCVCVPLTCGPVSSRRRIQDRLLVITLWDPGLDCSGRTSQKLGSFLQYTKILTLTWVNRRRPGVRRSLVHLRNDQYEEALVW